MIIIRFVMPTSPTKTLRCPRNQGVASVQYPYGNCPMLPSTCKQATGLRFLAHLSLSLIGKLKGYPWSGVRASSVRRRPSFVVHNTQTSSSPVPLARSKPNFMWSLLGWGNQILFTASWSHDDHLLGHMTTKMAATPKYGRKT